MNPAGFSINVLSGSLDSKTAVDQDHSHVSQESIQNLQYPEFVEGISKLEQLNNPIVSNQILQTIASDHQNSLDQPFDDSIIREFKEHIVEDDQNKSKDT